MASTSSTNAATVSRTTTDGQRGTFFFGRDAARTLVTLETGSTAVSTGLGRARAPTHASGCP